MVTLGYLEDLLRQNEHLKDLALIRWHSSIRTLRVISELNELRSFEQLFEGIE